jgi:hypothetical protein
MLPITEAIILDRSDAPLKQTSPSHERERPEKQPRGALASRDLRAQQLRQDAQNRRIVADVENQQLVVRADLV